MIDRNTFAVEIYHEATGNVIVCDTLAHLLACDDGLAEVANEITESLERGASYRIGGGAAECFIIRPAPQTAIVTA